MCLFEVTGQFHPTLKTSFLMAHLFTISIVAISNNSFLIIYKLDLENVIGAKNAFNENVVLTHCFQCLHKQLIYHYFSETVEFHSHVLFLETYISFLFLASKV